MKRQQRAMTLLEILVAISVLSMIAILIYGAVDGLSQSKRNLARLNDRYHQGRSALMRITREISAAFVSMHTPLNPSLQTRMTLFVGKDTSPADRLDMTTFSHRRMVANSHETDQNEVSYFGSPDPLNSSKLDLARREANMIDLDPQHGGAVHVMVEDIDLFDLKYLDPMTGLWLDSWDTTQVTAQGGRLPMQVRVTLVLRGGPGGRTIKMEEKVSMAIQQPVDFALKTK